MPFPTLTPYQCVLIIGGNHTTLLIHQSNYFPSVIYLFFFHFHLRINHYVSKNSAIISEECLNSFYLHRTIVTKSVSLHGSLSFQIQEYVTVLARTPFLLRPAKELRKTSSQQSQPFPCHVLMALCQVWEKNESWKSEPLGAKNGQAVLSRFL